MLKKIGSWLLKLMKGKIGEYIVRPILYFVFVEVLMPLDKPLWGGFIFVLFYYAISFVGWVLESLLRRKIS